MVLHGLLHGGVSVKLGQSGVARRGASYDEEDAPVERPFGVVASVRPPRMAIHGDVHINGQIGALNAESFCERVLRCAGKLSRAPLLLSPMPHMISHHPARTLRATCSSVTRSS